MDYAQKFGLVFDDGEGFSTPSSFLRYCTFKNQPAVLKVVTNDDELNSAPALRYFDGHGAVRVQAQDGAAMVLERAAGDQNLVEWVASGRDDDATRVMCDVIKKLHAPRMHKPEGQFRNLQSWMGCLLRYDGPDPKFLKARELQEWLLKTAEPDILLHGDIHHENVLYDHTRGWLAIDPKGLWGEPLYDYVNILCNPAAKPEIVLDIARFEKQARLIAEHAGLPLQRLIDYTYCKAAVSVLWCLSDKVDETFWDQLTQMIYPFITCLPTTITMPVPACLDLKQ